ncbi:hypothetical protein PIB30_073249 [Stylosanthes scabra]|uniref:Uncharacterized protein n=1 Tax=Stylosanthes scabra TaxID=79078 RepID=A0ABU6WQX8_9FABA|nr:hypothetical protein [Stylosanthes scabra]
MAFVLDGGKYFSRGYFGRQSVVPVLRSIIQREWQSEYFNSIFVTTGPSSGSADDFKILDMLNRVLARPTIELRKKIYHTRFEFEVCIEFGKSVGLVIKRSACPSDLLKSKSSPMVKLGIWLALLDVKFVQFQDRTTTSQGPNAILTFK